MDAVVFPLVFIELNNFFFLLVSILFRCNVSLYLNFFHSTPTFTGMHVTWGSYRCCGTGRLETAPSRWCVRWRRPTQSLGWGRPPCTSLPSRISSLPARGGLIERPTCEAPPEMPSLPTYQWLLSVYCIDVMGAHWWGDGRHHIDIRENTEERLDKEGNFSNII